MDQVHKLVDRCKAVHRSQENSLTLFQNKNAPLRCERFIQIYVVTQSQQRTKKCIQLLRAKQPVAKLRANQAMIGECSSNGTIQQARLAAPSRPNEETCCKSSCLPVCYRLIDTRQFLIATH